MQKIMVSDPVVATKQGWDTVWKSLQAADDLLKDTVGSKALQWAIAQTLKKLAHDTATYLATGGDGQKPLFYKEDWKEYLTNVGDKAAGGFLEEMAKDTGFEKFNICNPSFNVRFKVGFGIVKDHDLTGVDCTFSEMKNNWNSEIDRWESLKEDDFLNTAQNFFSPGQNDVGQMLSLQWAYQQSIINEKSAAEKNRESGNGFDEFFGIANEREAAPGQAQRELEQTNQLIAQNAVKYTGHPLTDASKVFLNQFFITLFNEKMRKLASGSSNITSRTKVGADWLSNPDAAPYNSGAAGAKENLRKVIQPDFRVRGDYQILADLTMCSDPTKAGPTDCVITDSFRQAIADQLTVGEAMDLGYLDSNFKFGFVSQSLEPEYNSGYPYRSMRILRKYRILPVGWELAAQYINEHIDQPEIDGFRVLEDLVSCFAATDAYDNGYNENWCVGLVDPNWVLKAPQNFCRREGPGPTKLFEQVVGTGENSRVQLQRDDTYCADEQTCISETAEGTCEFYGYCSEERRGWEFGTDSCEPRFNTCQTFNGEDGQSVSYLKNSLEWANCSLDNAGCEAYCQDFDFASSTYECTGLATDNVVFLDRDAAECDSDGEGCHEFIRAKPGSGVNLLYNSSFEEYVGTFDDGSDDDFAFWVGLSGEAVSDAFSGQTALQLNGNSTFTVDLGPSDWQLADRSYSLSFRARDCTDGDRIEMGSASSTLTGSTEWRQYAMVEIFPPTNLDNFIDIDFVFTGDCTIDAIKLEPGQSPTVYSAYRDVGVINQKLAPDYLGCDASNPPLECDDFVRECSVDEVGCELYTSKRNGISVPAVVDETDFCPAECVGYDEYVQTESFFDSAGTEWMIPKNEQRCNVEVAGCDEFTNLDRLGEGAEAREYYSELRQCRNPDGLCEEFYTWEGSSESGFQLKVFSLENNAGEPAVTEDDSAECSAPIYNLPPTDPGYNSDCREFYNRSGEISYHLYSRTISCSDNCHPYRRTKRNVDSNLNALTCNAAGYNTTYGVSSVDNDQFHWDAAQGDCYFCKNGGRWDNDHGCIYDAVPGEGKRCAASQAGCREYTGSSGNNTRVVLNDSFESGNIGNWGGDLSPANPNNMSLIAGGHSLSVSGGSRIASTTLGTIFQKNNAYVVSFLAQGEAIGNITRIGIGPNIGSMIEFAVTPIASALNGEWRLYQYNLSNLNNASGNYEVSSADALFIQADVNFFIDDVKLTEIVDRYYLIEKDAWNIPDSCLYDIADNINPMANLGCDAYTDRERNTHYISRFSNLCQDSAVGCELMIDTHNYSEYSGNTWREDLVDGVCDGSDGRDCVAIPDDQYSYVVYDQKKQCNRALKGCERLGETEEYLDGEIFTDTYLLNNPDQYDRILCDELDVDCEEWDSSDGTFYFKDPGSQICEWRQSAGLGVSSWDWYKKKVNRCDLDEDGFVLESDPICSSDHDCERGNCLFDDADHACMSIPHKTLGFGGLGNAVAQPGVENLGGELYYWAGVCPTTKSGCTEFVDPLSDFNYNMVVNPNFVLDLDGDTIPDGWYGAVNDSQEFFLEANTTYVMTIEGDNEITLTNRFTADNFFLFDENNELVGPNNTVNFVNAGGPGSTVSRTFYNLNAVDATLQLANAALGNLSVIGLRKAIINYQIKDNIDYETCNGIVNSEESCILFNERSQSGALSKTLIYDANNPASSPTAGPLGENDSNVLIKVGPDRVCDEWLACRSYTKGEQGENICLDVGLCNSVSDNGSCENFVLDTTDNQVYSIGDQGKFADNSGYFKAGYENTESSETLKSDLYPFAAMRQVGEFVNVPNGSFEFVAQDGYPVGWIWDGSGWSKDLFSVVTNPVEAQNEGVGLAPEGNGFLKLGSTYVIQSETIDVLGGVEYVLGAYLNSINLSVGEAQIKVLQVSHTGAVVSTTTVVSLATSSPWTYLSGSFTVDPGIDRIKLLLQASENTGAVIGNFYFDDIKIRSALTVQNDLSTAVAGDVVRVTQSCRLYPETDAKSCSYYESSGIEKRGWWGYCLEYDSYPGDPDTCLLWHPIERVRGDGIEEGAGYLGKTPVYYCEEAKTLTVLEYRRFHLYGAHSGCDHDSVPSPPPGYSSRSGGADCSCEGSRSHYVNSYIPSGTCLYDCQSDGSGWYEANGFAGPWSSNYCLCGRDCAVIDEAEDGILFYNPDSREVFEDTFAYCSKVVQTVNSVGANKYWSGRVYDGSDYIDPSTGFTYDSDDTPFGSIVPPYPFFNPYEWDGNTDANADGNQPLAVTSDQSLSRASHPYSIAYDSSATALDSFIGYCTETNDVCFHIPDVDSFTNKNDCPNGDGNCEAPAYISYNCATYGSYTLENSIGLDGGSSSLLPSDILVDLSDASISDVRVSCAFVHGSEGFASSTYMDIPDINADTSFSDDISDPVSLGTYDIDMQYDGTSRTLSCTCTASGWADNTSSCRDYRVYYDQEKEICTAYSSSGTYNPEDSIKRLFAESHGRWEWDRGHYKIQADPGWQPPVDACNGDGSQPRPNYPDDYCGVIPVVNNFTINQKGFGEVNINRNGFVEVNFNTQSDPNQLPLTMYGVDWGDNLHTVVSGVEMRDRQNLDNPHRLYHLYSYWDLVRKHTVDQALEGGQNTVYCGLMNTIPENFDGDSALAVSCPLTEDCCVVRPRVKIKDNWGWCTEGTDGSPCSYTGGCSDGSGPCENNMDCPASICSDGWQEWGGWIMVTD